MEQTYINMQTKEVLDMEIVEGLADNAMLKVKPELWIEWDFEKSDDVNIDIYTMSRGLNTKAWWYCQKCKDSYPQSISSKIRGSGCSICAGKYVSVSNCLNTTNPEIIKYLINLEDGDNYTRCSEKRLDWKCPDCDNIIKNKMIKDITRRRLSCSVCSDGVKFPEKVMSGVLSQLKIIYDYDLSMSFSENKRYDFYLPEYNLIIETHGKQHYEDSFKTIQGARNLDEEKENDRLKEALARENGFDYLIIDCRKSELDWIKNNIISSKLTDLFDLTNLDWDKIVIDASKSNKVECLNMYLGGRRDYQEMAKELKVDYATVMVWLKFWDKLGKCEYIPLDTRKGIVQLDMDNNFIKSWDSIWEARKSYKNVSKVLKNERSSDQGYRFMHKEDYDRFLENKESYNFRNNKVKKKIVQLTVNDEFIREWDSMMEASHSLGRTNQSGVSGVCQGRKKTSAGFKWMYKEDYDNVIKSK